MHSTTDFASNLGSNLFTTVWYGHRNRSNDAHLILVYLVYILHIYRHQFLKFVTHFLVVWIIAERD